MLRGKGGEREEGLIKRSRVEWSKVKCYRVVMCGELCAAAVLQMSGAGRQAGEHLKSGKEESKDDIAHGIIIA